MFGTDQSAKQKVKPEAIPHPANSPVVPPASVSPVPEKLNVESYFQFPGLTPELDKLKAALNGSRAEDAFQELNKLKGRKPPIENLDLVRAYAFLLKDQRHGALEALKEELRWFPDNQNARCSFDKVSILLGPPAESKVGDTEFREILKVIRPYTMVGEPRLLSLYTLAKDVLQRNVPGNFVECGVAAGGASALLAAMIKRHSTVPRKLFSFDTFEGMPPATAEDTHRGLNAENTGWGTGTCSAPIDSLMEAAGKLGAQDVVEPIKGLFADTIPPNKQRIGPIAFLHVDGDWYSSTRDVFDNLYHQVSAGGRLQVDDYGYWEGCKKAVHDFEKEFGLNFQINVIDDTGVWIPK